MEKLCEIIRETLSNEQKQNFVTCEQTLSEIGIYSIQFITIIVQAEIEFDFEFEDDFLSVDKFTDVNSIADYIYSVSNR